MEVSSPPAQAGVDAECSSVQSLAPALRASAGDPLGLAPDVQSAGPPERERANSARKLLPPETKLQAAERSTAAEGSVC